MHVALLSWDSMQRAPQGTIRSGSLFTSPPAFSAIKQLHYTSTMLGPRSAVGQENGMIARCLNFYGAAVARLTVITADKTVPVLSLELAIDILLCLLHGNIHVAI